MPSPSGSSIVDDNIKQVIKDAFVQIEHAQGVRGRARTGYYKVATLLLASVVEALLHEIIKKSIENDPSLPSKKTSVKPNLLHQIPASQHGSPKDLYIAERVTLPFTLNKRVLLSEMNDFAKYVGIIDAPLHAKIVYIRDKRNELHIQGLPSTSRRFTRQTTEKASVAIEKLFDIHQTI